MSPYVPDGIEWPVTGNWNLPRWGAQSRVRAVHPRPVLHSAMRLLRFQHLHGGFGRGADRATYDESVATEIELAQRI